MSSRALSRLVLAAALAAVPASAAAQGRPPAPPHTLVKQALNQIRSEWSHLLPASAWGGWDGSAGGLTEGNYAGWGGNAATQVPYLHFDDVDIMTVPSWQGTPQANSGAGGLTNGLPPYQPNGRVGVWLNAAALDSDLLFIKTALFHELVHVAQWRDAGGTWATQPDGTVVHSGDRERKLFELKEVEASARTLKFLQALLKKGEFSKKRIKGMISDQMANLQRHLREAAKDAEELGKSTTDRALLGRMLPKDLVALILQKKFASMGWADDGLLTNEDIDHVRDVSDMLDSIDGARDGVVAEAPPTEALRDAMLAAQADRELCNHPIVRAGRAWQRGRLPQALRTLDAARSRILRTAGSEDPEITRGALLTVDVLEASFTGVALAQPLPVFAVPLPGMLVGGSVDLVLEDAAASEAVVEAVFWRSVDGGSSWDSFGADRDSSDGWSFTWDSRTAPNGPVQLVGSLWTADAQLREARTEVFVDNLDPVLDPLVELISPPPGQAATGIAWIEALVHPGPFGPPMPVSARFEACADSPENCWEIGIDQDPSDGLSLPWDSTEVTDGPLLLRAVVLDASGGEALDLTGVFVDNEGGLLP
jgi:hypothetical protein